MNFNAFAEEDLELITLRLVLLGNIYNLKLFSHSISDEKRIRLLKSLITSQPPPIYSPTKLVPTPLNIRWIASRLLLSEGYKDFPSVNFLNLGFIEFSNMSDAITQLFKFALSRVENRPPEESKIITFAESFLLYYSKRLTIADFLLNIYTDYIIQVPLQKLFRNFQFRCFILINNLDKIDLNTLDVNFSNYNDYQPFKDLFQIYRGYQKDDFFPTFQSMIIKDKLFPNTIGNDSEKMVRSLIDTSLLQSKHFVEVLREHSYQLFKEQKIDEYIEKVQIIKGIEPWIFISHYYNSIRELSPESLPVPIEDTIRYFQNMNYNLFENNSIAADFLNRLQNDNSFFAMVRQNTGQTINSSMLYENSIPFFLVLFLKSDDPLPFKDLNEIHLFCVNDEDRLIDADFVWSYFAEVVAINALTKPDEAEDMIAQSGWYLSQINHSKIHHDVLIDIFSIMFLQQEIENENHEKKLKYVCYQSVAEIILTMLLGSSDDDPALMQQAQNGHLLIQFARSISNGVDFEDLIFPKEQQLLKAFQNEDWLIADHIAALNVHLSDMNILYKTVNEYLKKSKFHELLFSTKNKNDSFVSSLFDPTKSKSKFASVEIGLSFPDQIDALKAAIDIASNSPVILELIKRRYQKLLKEKKKDKSFDNFKSLLRAVKTLNEKDFALIKQNFSDLNATKWNLSPFSYKQEDESSSSENTENLHLLKSFLFYLDSLVGVVLNDEKLVENISEALMGDPSTFVNKLLNKGSINSAENVSKVIKQDMMLMFASEESATDDVIEQVSTENVPYALTLALTKEEGVTVNPIHDINSIAYRIANIALKSNAKRKEQIDIIFGKSKENIEANIELKSNELKEIFENELLKDDFDMEKVINISYSLNEETFSNFVLQYIIINNDYLSKIIEIVNCCGSINSKLYDSSMFLKTYLDSKIEIYPLENLFVYLLNNKKYKEATKLIQLFGNKIDNYINHLINAYSNELKNKNILNKNAILNISPKDKEVIESNAIIIISNNENSENSSSNEFVEEINDFMFDDLSEIKEKLIQNPDADFDNEIFDALLFYSETDIYDFCTTFRKAINLVKNKDKLIDYSLTIFQTIISQIQVNSKEIEDETWEILNKINSIFEKHFPNNENQNKRVLEFKKKISIMKSIVDHSPFSLYNFEYDFFDFGKNLSFIFPKLDLIDSLLSYYSNFNIPKNEFNIDSYIFKCCQLGITDFQIPFKIAQSRYDSENDENYHCTRSFYEDLALLLTPEKYFYEPLLILIFMNQFPPTEEMLSLINKDKKINNKEIQQVNTKITKTKSRRISVNRSISFESDISESKFQENEEKNKTATTSNSLPSILLTGTISNEHFFDRIQVISNKEPSSTFEIEPMKKVKDFFKENAPIDIVISYFTLKGDKSSAINLLEESGKVYDKKRHQELFKNSFFEKVISRPDDINQVLKNVMTIDRDLLVSVLLDQCPYLRFDVYSLLKEWKEAYKAATDVFCIPTVDSSEARLRQLNLLAWMENCLEKIPEKNDDIELKKIQVTLQKEVCHFAINNKIVCNFSEINLFKNDIQKESVVILLMSNFNIKLAIAVLRFFELNRARIGELSCDIFINEDIKKVSLFFKKFQKELDINIFREIFYAICLRLKLVLEVDQEMMLSYINMVENREFKRKLLYQFNFLKEAVDQAISDDDIEMIVSIANDAYFLQMTSILSKCTKFIEKKSKMK